MQGLWKPEGLLPGMVLAVGDLFWTTQSNRDGDAQLHFPPFQSSQQTLSQLGMFSATENAFINRTFFFPLLLLFPKDRGLRGTALLFAVYSYNLR